MGFLIRRTSKGSWWFKWAFEGYNFPMFGVVLRMPKPTVGVYGVVLFRRLFGLHQVSYRQFRKPERLP